jgi:hypothetical protein
MSKALHRLTNIDKDQRTASCLRCGPVKVYAHSGGWRCAIAEGKWFKGHARWRVSLAEYEELFRRQGGGCAICRRGGKLRVDHDHETGVVRGLLCNGCNRALGVFGDSAQRLQIALAYVGDGVRPEDGANKRPSVD